MPKISRMPEGLAAGLQSAANVVRLFETTFAEDLYVVDERWVRELSEVEKGLRGGGFFLTHDRRRDLANQLTSLMAELTRV